MEFGKSLRMAREAKGYTVGQLAEMTRMAPRTIGELENEDFSHIPAPIYGRGFVKLYCETVGLEAKPFVEEFMEILKGNRDMVIHERPVSVQPEPQPVEQAPEPPVPEPPAPELPQEEDEAGEEEPVDEREEPPPEVENPQPDLFQEAPATDDADKERTEGVLSRYAAPIRTMGASIGNPLSPAAWRMTILAAAACVLLLLLCLGLRAIYRTLSSDAPTSEPASTAEATSAPETAPAADAAAVPENPPAARTQQVIPPLYVD